MKTESIATPFVSWLKRFMAEQRLNNTQVAARFGVNDSLIGHYLRSNRYPTYVTLRKIQAAVPGIDMNELFR